ncbi:MAG: hypothetical protein JZU50_05535 [Desulfobulbaceae bacterium]|jgi:hypothetical protein|nr:hypothetical protein [Desulfobulbaceae bacterium]
MATVGSAMNVNLNLQNRLAVKSGGLPSMNWIKCCVAPIANTAMWKFQIEHEGRKLEKPLLNLSILMVSQKVDFCHFEERSDEKTLYYSRDYSLRSK